jgi:hypothetical protein|tara:strand:- start:59 stop:340 length:282 start_codon:yes stop_codon:yes gene_type:complete
MTSRSNAYITTLDPTSTDDMTVLSRIRAHVTAANKRSLKQQRVCVRGRKPITKKTITNFWTGHTSTVGFDHGGNVVGGLANASSLDVYIYARR